MCRAWTSSLLPFCTSVVAKQSVWLMACSRGLLPSSVPCTYDQPWRGSIADSRCVVHLLPLISVARYLSAQDWAETLQLSATEEFTSGIIRVSMSDALAVTADCSRTDILSMYASIVRGSLTMGLSPCLWDSYEHPRDNLSTDHPARWHPTTSIVFHIKIFITFSPMKLLRKLPPLNSRKVIALSVSFLRKIPQDVYTLLASHAWDDSVGGRIDQLHANLDA
jgi:hypothetical protein